MKRRKIVFLPTLANEPIFSHRRGDQTHLDEVATTDVILSNGDRIHVEIHDDMPPAARDKDDLPFLHHAFYGPAGTKT